MLKSNNLSHSLSNIEGVRDLNPETAANYSGGRGFRFGPNPDVILYTNPNAKGASLNINAATGDGIPNVGDDFNDRVSSIVVKKGSWRFFEDSNYGGQNTRTLGPGYYNLGANDDLITSAFRVR